MIKGKIMILQSVLRVRDENDENHWIKAGSAHACIGHRNS